MKLSVLLFFFFQLTISQNDTLKGVIFDSYDKAPVPGVSVTNLSTKEKSLSNFDGEYFIKAKIGDSLLFVNEGKYEKCFQKVSTLVKDLKPLNIYTYSNYSMNYDRCKHNKEVYALVLIEIGEPKTHKDEYNDCYASTGYNNIRSFSIVNDVFGNYQNSTIDIVGFSNYLLRKNKKRLVFVEKRCDEYWYINSQNVYMTKENGLVIPYIFLDFTKFKNSDINIFDVKFSERMYYNKNNPNLMKEIDLMPTELYYIKKDKLIPTKGISLTDYSNVWLKEYNVMILD